jgi:hypothetical protein
MTPRFNPSTRSYRAAQTRFLIRWSIAGMVIVAVAVYLGGHLK